MLAAASVSFKEAPQAKLLNNLHKKGQDHEHDVLNTHAAVSLPILAVDLDDTLSRTNEIIAEWHNAQYGSAMDISTFYYYYYWKNPFWGTIRETFEKVEEFYSTKTILAAKPVAGAFDGITALRNMGYKLIIVTARTQDNKDETWEWVEKHFPGLFHGIVYTGQFKDAQKEGHDTVTRLEKAQVCFDLGAKLLIDDSAENALQCITFQTPISVLLFGDYEWNKRISGPGDAIDEMSFERRLAANGGKEFWKEETIVFQEGAPLHRAKDWHEVVDLVTRLKDEGKL